MPNPATSATGPHLGDLSVQERTHLLAEKVTEHDALAAQVAALHKQMEPLRQTIADLTTLVDRDLVAGRDPAEFFTDSTLREQVVERGWARGRGSATLDTFMSAAFGGLAPNGFFGYEWTPGESYEHIDRVWPRLAMCYGQDIDPVVDALGRIYPALAVDGTMLVSILEHTGEASLRIEMTSPHTASLQEFGRSPLRAGTVQDIVRYVTTRHWFDGGPRNDD